LKTVDIQAQRPVEFVELSVGVFLNQAIIAPPGAQSLHFSGPQTLIVFQRRASLREYDPFLFAIRDQCLIDEFPAVIGINPQDWKGEERPSLLEGCQHRFLASVQQRQTFGQSGRHIRERQGVQVATLNVSATMSHQVRLQKAGLGLIPLLERADGNLLLEQRSRSCGGNATLTQCALRTQEAVRCRCAHRKELAAALLCDVEMLMPLQHFYQGGEKGDEPFGADAVGGVPSQEENMLDFWPIPRWAWTLKRLLHLFSMVEEPPRVFTIVSSSALFCDGDASRY